MTFYKDLYDLIDSPSSVSADTIDPTTGGSALNDGSGRSYGAEVLLRHAPSGEFFGWVVMPDEVRAVQSATDSYRLFDFDRRIF